jgi:hypothetical protein
MEQKEQEDVKTTTANSKVTISDTPSFVRC